MISMGEKICKAVIMSAHFILCYLLLFISQREDSHYQFKKKMFEGLCDELFLVGFVLNSKVYSFHRKLLPNYSFYETKPNPTH